MTADDSREAPRSTPPPGDADAKDSPRRSERPASATTAEASSEHTDAVPTSSEQPGGPTASDPQQDELAALKKERSELSERLLRTAADFDNFRKRSRREIEDAKLRGKDDTLRELLPVFDNLERALRASGDESDAGAVLEGVRMVLKLFEDTAQRMGLNRVPTTGERFDPAVHEAIQQAESSEHAPGTIITEITPGYMFGKRLLRAAMVIVARRPVEAKPVKDADPTDPPSDAKGAGEVAGSENKSKSTPPDAADTTRADTTSAEGTAP